MRGHDRRRPGLDRRSERHQLAAPQVGDVEVDHGERQVGVVRRRAVAGEVLDAGARHPTDCRPSTAAADVAGRRRPAVGAERADADDRVARVRVDVGARRQRQVDAERREPPPETCGRRRRSASTSSTKPNAAGPGVSRPGLRVEAGDVAALLVDRDHDVRSRARAERRRSSRDLFVVDDVLRRTGTRRRARRATASSSHAGAVGPDERAIRHAAAEPFGRASPSLIPSPPLRSARWPPGAGRAGRTRPRGSPSASSRPSRRPSRCPWRPR